MADPTHGGSSGRDVEAAVREIIRGAVDPGGRSTPPRAEEHPAEAPRPAGTGSPAAETAPLPGNGKSPPARPAGSGRIAGPLESFLRHPFLVLLPLVLLVGVGVLVGTQRDAEHTAKARVQVGRDNVPPFYLESVVSGSQALASTYSRTIYTEPVIRAAARGARVPVSDVRGNLFASQVPGSTLIEITARSTSPRAATAMANAAGEGMIDFVRDLTTDTDRSADLFARYKKAQRAFHRADARVRRLNGARRPAALARARTVADTARLRAEDLAGRYRAATGEAEVASSLDLIAPAATTDSDRGDKLQELVVVGAIAGIVLGLGLALLRTNWTLLRSLRRR